MIKSKTNTKKKKKVLRELLLDGSTRESSDSDNMNSMDIFKVEHFEHNNKVLRLNKLNFKQEFFHILKFLLEFVILYYALYFY